jgi:3-hydroxybutyryl-CoA dehydrogenase
MFDDWQVLVAGAGTMGTGIAQVYAVNGFATTLVDLGAESLARAEKTIANNITLLVKEKLASPEDNEKTKRLISYATTDQLEHILPRADLVVESVFEDAQAKRELFAKLNQYCRKDCIKMARAIRALGES